jgi:phosphoglycolate phosphatase
MPSDPAIALHDAPRPRRLILWDVDGTLLSAGPIGREAFYSAAGDVLGREVADSGVQMSGKTDPLIALEILERAGIPESDARRLLPDMLAGLARHLVGGMDRIRAEGRVHPGVVAVLERLDGEPDVIQTVLTGNLAVNARAKVGAFGLERFLDLDVGAYGSDEAERDLLIPVAQARVRERYGHAPAPGETWVVGDTARDLACARAGGARCLLVATGRIAFGELQPLGADGVLTDLADIDSVAALLAG